jgi:hypothetical protein
VVENALSIDVEEHCPAHAFETAGARRAWDRMPSRPNGALRGGHGANLHRTDARLRRLLGTFRCAPLREAFAAQLAS